MTILEIIEPYRQKRLANTPFNFSFEHVCPQCGVRYLCPDRYESAECIPAKCFGRNAVREMACLPCAASLTPEERAAWNEAHALDIPKGKAA